MIFSENEGHCLLGPDSGAEGCGKREQDLTRLVGGLVTVKLKAKGHTVIRCTVNSANSVNSALNTIVLMSNIQKVDLFFSIHFNASNTLGHGTEIYTYGGKQMVQATNILKNIARLGYVNRGIKDGSHLAVVHNTKAPSMLIECCFIDNKNDMALFNAEKMADAIVSGLVGASDFKPTTSIPNSIFPRNGTVTADKLNVREDAGAGFKIVDTLDKNNIVRVTAAIGTSWYAILRFGTTRYVSSQYIKLD